MGRCVAAAGGNDKRQRNRRLNGSMVPVRAPASEALSLSAQAPHCDCRWDVASYRHAPSRTAPGRPDGRARHRLRSRRHVCRHRGRARRLQRVAGRSQPDRPRRRHRDGADDRCGGAGLGDGRPLAPSPRRYARRGARALQRGAIPAALRGRPRLYPRNGCLGRRLGAPRRAHRAGARTGSRSAALCLCRFPQHGARRLQDAAHGRQPDRRHPQGRRSLRCRSCCRRRRSRGCGRAPRGHPAVPCASPPRRPSLPPAA